MHKVNQNQILEQLSKHLFWDVDRSLLDFDKNEKLIVQRVLDYGLLKDWKIIRQQYGVSRIAEIATTLRTLEPTALSFIATLAKLPLTRFRCYTSKALTTRHWHY
jgi:hypothetical protein